jgi:membrane-bound lytic murein transglycosylase B
MKLRIRFSPVRVRAMITFACEEIVGDAEQVAVLNNAVSRLLWCVVASVMVVCAPASGAAKSSHKSKQASAKQASAAAADSYAQRADVRAFIEEMHAEHGFDRRALQRIFAAAHVQPQIIAAMQRPLLEPPKWYEYAPQFVSAKRIDGGVAFWREHATTLQRAERDYGVPPEIVVAIIGVETFYGRNTGRHRVIDALSTLAFDYPRRATFFRGELKSFLLLTRELGISPLEAKGSFAGAIGLPQFMPGSYRNFAVDFDGDGHADLWGSADDAIGSVANYLVRHDWERDQPVLIPATIDSDKRDVVLRRLDGGMSERRALEAWSADGVSAALLPANLAPSPVGLLMLEEGMADGAASYWIAANNFYVLTRYNRSRLYASAVWHLARALREAHAAQR